MSLRPTEPLNSTSPTWAKRISLLKNTTLPGEWPGQCRMSKVNSPMETWSPSSSQRSGAKSRTPVMPKRAPLVTTLSSRCLSAMCGPSIGTFSASRSSAAPPTWSIWPWVSQIFSTDTLVCLIVARIFGTSPPGSITTAFLVASHQISVQFCSNSVTGIMIAPAFALVSVSWVMSAHCRFFAGRQGEIGRKKQAADASLVISVWFKLNLSVVPALPRTANFGMISKMRQSDESWWRHGIFYQIYPRSFQDSDADGVGDIVGVIDRLPYLQELGVDAVWLSPIFPSPMADFGYDISDYTDVDPLFGMMEDFDALVGAAHANGLKVILDLVPNHTSDRHPWFIASRSSRDDEKRDWYIWREPAADGGPPNNWMSEFGGGAWAYDAATRQYYYHAFLAQQPDLNW